MRTVRHSTIAALALALPLGLAACGGSTEAGPGSAGSATSSSSPTTSAEETTSSGDTTAAEPFGPGCAAVPKDGKGSFKGMATDPVATAASNNPVLSTLVTAVTEADLGQTLNSTPDITVFAPTNDAFKAVPAKTLDELGRDPAKLKSVLTYHVLPGKVLAADVKNAKAKTAQGADVALARAGAFVTVEDAMVQSADIVATNGVVHTVDRVLMPPVRR